MSVLIAQSAQEVSISSNQPKFVSKFQNVRIDSSTSVGLKRSAWIFPIAKMGTTLIKKPKIVNRKENAQYNSIFLPGMKNVEQFWLAPHANISTKLKINAQLLQLALKADTSVFLKRNVRLFYLVAKENTLIQKNKYAKKCWNVLKDNISTSSKRNV